MKVMFINEPFTVEPLGIGYLASAINNEGHISKLALDNGNLKKEIKNFKPDVIGYSVTTGKHKHFLELNMQLKKSYNFTSVFGGSHPTYYPEIVIEPLGYHNIDYIIRGESEKSFCNLLNNFVDHKVIDFVSLEQNLDNIAFPDREFLYTYPENRNNPIKNVMTSRGCKYSCNYCFNSLYREFYKGQKWVRYRSPENVIAECEELKKYPTKFIFFQDDEFLSNPKLIKLLKLYKKNIKIPFHCQLRIELLTDERAELLKDSGCTGVTFAIECGNPAIRELILKCNMSDRQILAGAKILHKHGLKFRTENMLGLPGESLKSMLKTVKINAKCKPTIAWASIFQPYPKLKISEGIEVKCDYKYSFFEDTVMDTKLRKQIINLQRLFGVACDYLFIKWVLRYMIEMPNNRVYNWIYKIWKKKQYLPCSMINAMKDI